MLEKTLGEIAWRAYLENDAGHVRDWERVANAVIAEYERRRWRSIESAPEDGTPIIVNAKYLKLPPWVVWCDHKCTALATDGESYWPWTDFDSWTPIPAPPKEASDDPA